MSPPQLSLPASRLIEPVALLAVALILFLNFGHMAAMSAMAGPHTAAPTASLAPASALLPRGVPLIYGSALGVSFDSAAQAMPILENFDRGPGAITLTGALLQRYIAIASQTSCEFCCGATTLAFPDGKPACGCAHSAAMRGVARYLLQQHPDLSDADILAEVNRWKAAFFPGPTVQKATQTRQPSATPLPAQVGGC